MKLRSPLVPILLGLVVGVLLLGENPARAASSCSCSVSCYCSACCAEDCGCFIPDQQSSVDQYLSQVRQPFGEDVGTGFHLSTRCSEVVPYFEGREPASRLLQPLELSLPPPSF